MRRSAPSRVSSKISVSPPDRCFSCVIFRKARPILTRVDQCLDHLNLLESSLEVLPHLARVSIFVVGSGAAGDVDFSLLGAIAVIDGTKSDHSRS